MRFYTDRKGIYHSDFVMASESGGPIAIQLTGKVITNVKQGLGTVYFKEPDGDKEHYYTIENPFMLELFQKMPRNEVLHVTMYGTKEPETQSAIVTVAGQIVTSQNHQGGGAPPVASPPPQARQAEPPRQTAPRQQQEQRQPDPPRPAPTVGDGLTDFRATSVQAQWAEALKAAHDVLNYAINDPKGREVFPMFAGFYRNLTPDALLTKTCEVATGMVITQNTRAGLIPMRAAREQNNGQH